MEGATGNTRRESECGNTSTPWKLHFVKSPVIASSIRDNSDSGFESFVSGLSEKENHRGTITFQKIFKSIDDDNCNTNKIDDPHSVLELKTDISHTTTDGNKQNPPVGSPSIRSFGLWKPYDLCNESFIVLDESNEDISLEYNGEIAVNISGVLTLSAKSDSLQCPETRSLKPVANASTVLLGETPREKSINESVRDSTPISETSKIIPTEAAYLSATEDGKSNKGDCEEVISTIKNATSISKVPTEIKEQLLDIEEGKSNEQDVEEAHSTVKEATPTSGPTAKIPTEIKEQLLDIEERKSNEQDSEVYSIVKKATPISETSNNIPTEIKEQLLDIEERKSNEQDSGVYSTVEKATPILETSNKIPTEIKDQLLDIEETKTNEQDSEVYSTFEKATPILETSNKIPTEIEEQLLDIEEKKSSEQDTEVYSNVKKDTPISETSNKIPIEIKEQLSGIENEKSNKEDSKESYSTHTSSKNKTGLTSVDRNLSEEQVKENLSSEPQPVSAGPDSERLENGNFVSSDPQENADNNNPEWELLKKLETDEERYKAVRLRWRNLVIPNPNQNLTYRGRGYRAPEVKENVLKEANNFISRKRTHSADPKEHQAPTKRQRTFSCTDVFDRKILDIQQNLNRERNVIRKKHEQAVQNLVDQTNMQLSSYMPGSVIDQRIRSLHVQNVAELRYKCDDQLAAAESQSKNQLSSLQKAMEEVRVFNSFYQGLEEGRDDALLLTQEQLVEVLEEDHLYECFAKFYKG